MELLFGADVVAAMNIKMKNELASLGGYKPHLAIIRVGSRPDDIAYENGAVKRCDKAGLACTLHHFDESITYSGFKEAFLKINSDDSIDGILLLRPLPKHMDEREITGLIDPLKDVDGINPVNMAKVFQGDDSGYAPCTAEAVMEMLSYTKLDISGKRAVVVGRSMVIGKPVAMMLMKKNATVTVCHTKTLDMEGICSNAQILVAAAGKAKMINKKHVTKGAYVFDVGINIDADGKMCGDVDMEDIKDIEGICTPVPKGVGTVTTSVLASHVIRAAKVKRGV
ncbi:MAG: bifunctional 5,10-methylenetetrahydrofolate dehydrogenase/5,10-methenyltetrahydrofolate cyclohydrolase [Clostridia bacterium]